MATITLSSNAPMEGNVSFVLGNAEFSLEGDGTYETDSPDVIAAAASNSFLSVKIEPGEEKGGIVQDQNDPQFNPRIDHLSGLASQEVKDAAAMRDFEIQKAVHPQTYANRQPPVKAKEEVRETVAPTPMPVPQQDQVEVK